MNSMLPEAWADELNTAHVQLIKRAVLPLPTELWWCRSSQVIAKKDARKSLNPCFLRVKDLVERQPQVYQIGAWCLKQQYLFFVIKIEIQFIIHGLLYLVYQYHITTTTPSVPEFLVFLQEMKCELNRARGASFILFRRPLHPEHYWLPRLLHLKGERILVVY